MKKKEENQPIKPNTHALKKNKKGKKEKREIGNDPAFLCHYIEVGHLD